MANNVTNITLPSGEAVSVPAWATEQTLQTMMMIAQRAGVLSKSMLTGLKAADKVDQEILDAIEKSFEGIQANTEANDEQVKGKASMLLKGAERIKDTATFFGDSEKPLTSLVKATENLVNKMDGPNGKGGLAKLGKKFEGLGKFMDGFGGQAVGVATDIVLALAGWNAAKFEQFAEVQKKMIDSGAIMYETGATFDKLYTDSFQAGITYNAFAEAVGNFGGTMTAIGGDVSQGGVQFLKMFKTMSKNTDALGDLGMLNTELLNTYASYIETQRLTGAIDKKLANNGAGLETSFKELVVESTAMASLTALNRNDIMQRQMAALSDTFLAAGGQTLRDQGMDKTATITESIMKQMSIFSDQGPASGLMQEFEQSFNKAVLEFSGDISKFDVAPSISNEGRAAFDKAMPGFLNRINELVRNGEMGPGIAHNYMLKEFQKMDMEKIASAAAEDGSPLQLIQNLQSSGILIDKNFGEFTKLAEKEYNEAITKTKTKLNESGKTTVAMNDMAKMFLTAQEFITLPMQKFGDILETVTSFMKDSTTTAAETQQNLFSTVFSSDESKQIVKDAQMIGGPPGSDNNTEKVIPGVPIVKKEALTQLQNRLTNLQNEYKLSNNIPVTMGARAKKQAKLKREMQLLEDNIALIKRQNKALDDKLRKEEDQKFNANAEQRYNFL